MNELLAKARKLHCLIKYPNTNAAFAQLVEMMSGYVEANVYLIGRRGKILGYSFFSEDFNCNFHDVLRRSESFPESYNQELLLKTVTQENYEHQGKACLFHNLKECPLPSRKVTIVPVVKGEERLATLVLVKKEIDLSASDLFLVEISAVVAGSLILGMKVERLVKEGKCLYQAALKTLSSQELKAVRTVLRLLHGDEGIVVITKIAEENGISRALIINALQKLAGAGVLALRSHGMKGTSIKITDEGLLTELQKIKI